MVREAEAKLRTKFTVSLTTNEKNITSTKREDRPHIRDPRHGKPSLRV